MNSALKTLEEIISDLPAASQAEVIDFADFLREKERKKLQPENKKKRVGGLLRGKIQMSEDFTAPLPDEFWFGEDLGVIKK